MIRHDQVGRSMIRRSGQREEGMVRNGYGLQLGPFLLSGEDFGLIKRADGCRDVRISMHLNEGLR